MRIFVTGASGFVGSAIVKELLQAGHQVLGLARSDSSADALVKAGAEVHRGNIDDLDSLVAGAVQCDAVIHTAFNHDFSRFKQNCEDDRGVIRTLGGALAGTGKPLVITSAIGVLRSTGLTTEDAAPLSAEVMPRAATEEAAQLAAQNGVKTYIVRLPPTTHGAGDHGFVSMLAGIARDKGASVYVDEGNNRWPAVHRLDAAVLYRLIVEQQPAQRVFHAVAEEGVPFRQIATAIGRGMNLPVASKDKETAALHFGWFLHFASMDCPASSEQTRKTLGWQPTHATLLEDVVPGVYF